MSYLLEEKFREAACLGDAEGVQRLIGQNININAQNCINGWTALHWASKRGHEDVVRILLNNGADQDMQTNKGEKAVNLASHTNIAQMLGDSVATQPSYYTEDLGIDTKFIPNYIKNEPLNGKIDLNTKITKNILPITNLPSHPKALVLKVRINGSCDPDFIEVEVPLDNMTFAFLLNVCCEELGISASQVERLRKLPNTRLRNDNDVRRLTDWQEIEIVLKGPGLEKINNSYQSISSCKDQTILY